MYGSYRIHACYRLYHIFHGNHATKAAVFINDDGDVLSFFCGTYIHHGRNIIVLKPESLRQEMISILKDMKQSYETGECLNGEE